MNNKTTFSRLLNISQTYELYCSIGKDLRTSIDIRNTYYDKESMRNTLTMLLETSIVSLRFNRYSKKISDLDIKQFKSVLTKKIQEVYKNDLAHIFSAPTSYDEGKALYKIKQNMVPLSLSGLLMILNDLDVVDIFNKEVFLMDSELAIPKRRRAIHGKRVMSLLQLKDKLTIQDSLGLEAEIMAIEFEQNLLHDQGIEMLPLHISQIDVSAGYDIASFTNRNSIVPDKFIEVKSCADDSYKFFISKNELSTAKRKESNYFLYLYNRSSKEFKVIQNPSVNIFENQEWATESQVFSVHRMK